MAGGFLVGVVGIKGADGERVDRPDSNDNRAPIMLRLGPGITADSATPSGGLTEVTLSATGGGGGGGGVDDLEPLREIVAADRADKQNLVIGNLAQHWMFLPDFGANVPDDASLVVKPNDVLLAAAGRWVNVSSTPTVQFCTTLRNCKGLYHKRVRCLAYSVLGDGGGGEFYLDSASTATDNGGTIFTPTGIATGRWLRQFSGDAIRLKWFGTKGNTTKGTATAIATGSNHTFSYSAASADMVGMGAWLEGAAAAGANLLTTVASVVVGVSVTLTALIGTSVTSARFWYGTDDTAAIRSCASAALALPEGGRVEVERGKCFVSNFIDISNSNASKSITFVGLSNTSEFCMFVEDGLYALTAQNITIQHMRLTGAWSRAINLNTGANVRVIDCYIDGGTRTPTAGFVIGVNLDGIQDWWVERCTFRNMGIPDKRTVAIQAGAAGACSKIVASRNNIKIAAWGGGIICYNPTEFTFANNNIDLLSASTASAPTPDGYGYGIMAYRDPGGVTQHGTVTGNNVRNTPANAIFLQTCGYTAVTGNSCYNVCTSVLATSLAIAGIAIQETIEQSCVIGNNVVRLSGQYGYTIQGTGIGISNNTALDCALAGISIADSGQDCVIECNTIKRCQYGVLQQVSTGFLRGTIIKDNQITNCTSSSVHIYEGYDLDISGNKSTRPGGQGFVLLGGTRNKLSHNESILSITGYGFDIRSSQTTLAHNIAKGNLNGGARFDAACVGLVRIGNDFTENGAPALVTGTVDLTGLTWDSVGSGSTNGKFLYYTVNGVAKSVSFFLFLRDPQHLVDWINDLGREIYAVLSATNRLLLMTRKGTTGATLVIGTGANDAATILGVNGLSATGSAAVVGAEVDASSGPRSRLAAGDLTDSGGSVHGALSLVDGGGLANGKSLVTLHQDDGNVSGIEFYLDSTSKAVPIADFYSLSTSFFGRNQNASGAIIWWADSHAFRDHSGNPLWFIRNTATGIGKGWILDSTAGAQVIGQDDLITNGATANAFGIGSQNATGTTSTGGGLDVWTGSGTTAHGVGNLRAGGQAGTVKFSWGPTGLAVFGHAKAAQSADISALIDNTTGTPSLTIPDPGTIYSQATMQNIIASLLAQINALRTHARAHGWMA